MPAESNRAAVAADSSGKCPEAASAPAASESDTLTILGDNGDGLNAGTGWTDGGFDGNGNHVFTQSVSMVLATLVVDPDVTLNVDITA